MTTPYQMAQTGSQQAADPVRVSLLRAIGTQAYNAEIYESFAPLFQEYQSSLAAIFRRMAAEEFRYGAQLEQLYPAKAGTRPFSKKESKAAVQSSLRDYVMTLEQALRITLRVAEQAQAFYRQEDLQTSDCEVQQIYRELARLWEIHMRILQEKLATAADFTSR
ncbi:MAG: hypothetical protein HY651_02105 [Acidobacteria bacterium]|nr:hypothetical protein [Acidobacteriota bacterium]